MAPRSARALVLALVLAAAGSAGSAEPPGSPASRAGAGAAGAPLAPGLVFDPTARDPLVDPSTEWLTAAQLRARLAGAPLPPLPPASAPASAPAPARAPARARAASAPVPAAWSAWSSSVSSRSPREPRAPPGAPPPPPASSHAHVVALARAVAHPAPASYEDAMSGAALAAAGASAASAAAAAAAAAAAGNASAARLAAGLAAARRAQAVVGAARATGPLFPTFAEDQPADLTKTFANQLVLVQASSLLAVPLPSLASCNVRATAFCATNLSTCLGVNVLASSRGDACRCFDAHGKCYKSAGCVDLLPRADVLFCFNRFFCDHDTCVGNGARGGAALGVVAVAAVAAAAWASARGAR